MFSLCPKLITSSKAKMRSNAARLIASSSSIVPAYSGTSFDSKRSVSRSSKILLPLLVTSSRNMPCTGGDSAADERQGAVQAGMSWLTEVLLVGQVTAG